MKFKKIMSVIASAVMLSSTIGFAAAASYPEPFVSGGTANGAVIVGANAAVTDWSAAINVQTNLQGLVTTTGSSTSIQGTAWQAKTSSDKLELGESINGITSYVDSGDLPLLLDGTISNEKGTAKYEQFLYFEGGSAFVDFYQDDEDNVGLFYKIPSGEVIARYVMEFTSALKSDLVSPASTYEDIQDETINILGKEYVVTKAVNSSTANTDLTLMSGSSKGTVSNGEEVVIGGRTVSVIVSATNAAQFTIDGETTNKLAEGDSYRLSDGTYLGVTDITYQDFAGGMMQSTVYVGADKLFIDDASNLQVNAETINNALCTVTESFSSDDVSITQIAINLTAEDDLYVPINGKLSKAYNFDEPEVLLTQNWDIEFKGLEAHETEEIKLTPTGSDKRYTMKFNNYGGNEITLPLVFTNDSGIFGGEKTGDELVLNASADGLINITKDDYFILNTADPRDATANARSYVVQYKNADKATDTDPKVTFDILGVETGREMTLAASGTFSLKGLGGATFNFINTSSCDATTNCDIRLNGNSYASGSGVLGLRSAFIRTEHNALINITDLNATVWDAPAGTGAGNCANWIIALSIDDANRDGDKYIVAATTPEKPFVLTLNNASAADIGASININGSEITDPSNTDLVKQQTRYGVYIESEDPSGSPLTLTATIPDGIVEPLVYVTSGDVTIVPGGTGAGGTILVVKDSEVDSVKDKNLVVVGGSCINSVAAKILGSETPLCTTAFTEKTQVSAGQYIIKTVASPYAAADSGKVAMLVAGYDAADTTTAVAKAMEATTKTDVDTSQVYPITTTTTTTPVA